MSRTNRDHAKKKQRPMIEDIVIAEQLKTLLIPAITAQKGCYSQPKWDVNRQKMESFNFPKLN
jgi:hypothetical protein